jgi:hypothetical protein
MNQLTLSVREQAVPAHHSTARIIRALTPVVNTGFVVTRLRAAKRRMGPFIVDGAHIAAMGVASTKACG